MKHYSSGSEFEKLIGYSRAVKEGNFLFVSGTTGYNYETMTISDGVVDQAEQTIQNIIKVLEEAGTSLDRVVRVRYILSKREHFEPCWPILRKYFGESRPAATAIIADLMDEKMKIEIEVTASL
ncbi:RidA family protein [Reichenbachiella versicolor]|uniref:RidA family protein n=1 Tax=Reichenbachiella versicolor TaxID=1821036 RepID=UPI000D6E337E|nr:RidA family protein [Reichenbachiella versicolor]